MRRDATEVATFGRTSLREALGFVGLNVFDTCVTTCSLQAWRFSMPELDGTCYDMTRWKPKTQSLEVSSTFYLYLLILLVSSGLWCRDFSGNGFVSRFGDLTRSEVQFSMLQRLMVTRARRRGIKIWFFMVLRRLKLLGGDVISPYFHWQLCTKYVGYGSM